jgi:protein TonB
MKTFMFTLFFIITSIVAYSQGEIQVIKEEPPDSIYKLWVDTQPVFRGNYVKFLQDNLKYPEEALKHGIEGRVVVGYILEKDSSITNVKVLRGIGYGCDEEAVKVVKSMSKMWVPGKYEGMAVRFKTMRPITFRDPKKH